MNKHVRRTYLCMAAAFALVSCMSGGHDSIKKSTPAEQLSEIFVYPQLYLDKNTVLEGIIHSVEVRNVHKDVTLFVLELSPAESRKLLTAADPMRDKFIYLSKLRIAEEIFKRITPLNTPIRRADAEEMQHLACEFKIASKQMEGMSYFLEGHGKKDTSQAVAKVSEAYSLFGNAYFLFQKAALLELDGTEFQPVALPQSEEVNSDASQKTKKVRELLPSIDLPSDQVEFTVGNRGELVRSLNSGAKLVLEVSEYLQWSRTVLLRGLHSFEYEKIFQPGNSYDIMTNASLMVAYSWEAHRAGNAIEAEKHNAVAIALKELGLANKMLNEGIKELSVSLNKTAVHGFYAKAPALKCAYFGYNGSHLVRCAQVLKGLGGDVPVRVRGKLVRSDLREEVNILWLKAENFEVDGLRLSFNYGDESGAMKNAVEVYEWAESVEEGK